MDHSKGKRNLFKKIIAVTLGITIAMGSLMLPNNFVRNELTTASAFSIKIDDVTYDYRMEPDHGSYYLVLTNVKDHGETVEIPSSITHNGIEYPVGRIGFGFLKEDTTAKTVIFPESVKWFDGDVLRSSSIENIILPNSVEHISDSFASKCSELKSVKYEGTNIKYKNLGKNIFGGSNQEGLKNSGLLDDNGILTLGNWLLKLPADLDVEELKVTDLSQNGVKIEGVAQYAAENQKHIKKLDLEGVKYLNEGSFFNSKLLDEVVNAEDVIFAERSCLDHTPWYSRIKDNGFTRLGDALLYYKTDSDTIDLEHGQLEGIKYVSAGALVDCEKLETIRCSCDCKFELNSFFKKNEYEKKGVTTYDPLYLDPPIKIKDFYVKGQKVTYSTLINDPDVYAWFKNSYKAIEDSEFVKTMVEKKTKELFRQMQIPYYGLENNAIGTHTPTEEFYIRLKIYDYISIYRYDLYHDYVNLKDAFLLGGKLTCTTYAEMAHYMLECAGVGAKTYFTNPPASGVHYWNTTKIGDEWFENDDGWEAQGGHGYFWFMKSSEACRRSGVDHIFQLSFDSFHLYPDSGSTEQTIAQRTLGDIDGNEQREKNDVAMLWDYVKGNSDSINEKAADLNFDGVVDVTDAVLLDHFLNGKALDPDNIPIDALAPTNQVAFLNGEDYDDIRYAYTDREGYIELPELDFEAPEGKVLSYDLGEVGKKVRVTTPMKVIKVKWIDEPAEESSVPESSEPDSSTPDSSSKPNDSSRPDSTISDPKDAMLGDVNYDYTIDIEDAVAIIQHINGITPLTADEETRADVSKDGNIDIDDAVTLISYINGNSTF